MQDEDTMIAQALSIVAPAVDHILDGRKPVEIRSWLPPQLPFCNLALVQNSIYLRQDGAEDPNGLMKAVVDVAGVHQYSEAEAGQLGYEWKAGYERYHCWEHTYRNAWSGK